MPDYQDGHAVNTSAAKKYVGIGVSMCVMGNRCIPFCCLRWQWLQPTTKICHKQTNMIILTLRKYYIEIFSPSCVNRSI